MLKAIAKWAMKPEHWEFLSWYRSRFGVCPAVRAYVGLLRENGLGRAPNELGGGSVLLRPGTVDQDVYDEVFTSRKYDIDLGEPLFIVDAGAHIGLSAVFFACKYPKATIVAVEPEQSNFRMLLMNTREYGNIRPIQAGVWSRRTRLRIEDGSVCSWGFRVLECPSDGGLPAVGIRDIMSDFMATKIDVLKMDIEGSEVEVLSEGASWIDDVRSLIIELHDRFRPGCSDALDEVLSGHEYCRSLTGESVVITSLSRSVTGREDSVSPGPGAGLS